jgi:hypothetical protein
LLSRSDIRSSLITLAIIIPLGILAWVPFYSPSTPSPQHPFTLSLQFNFSYDEHNYLQPDLSGVFTGHASVFCTPDGEETLCRIDTFTLKSEEDEVFSFQRLEDMTYHYQGQRHFFEALQVDTSSTASSEDSSIFQHTFIYTPKKFILSPACYHSVMRAMPTAYARKVMQTVLETSPAAEIAIDTDQVECYLKVNYTKT